MAAFKRFILIRHGEAVGEMGKSKISFSAELSEQGREHAQEMAAYVCRNYEVDACYSSPFVRCLLTAQPLSEQSRCPVMLEPMLFEFFHAEWFGEDLRKLILPSLNEVAARFDWVGGEYSEVRWWPRIAEQGSDVDQRLNQLARRLVSDKEPAGTIACVGHWASVASLLVAFFPDVEIPGIHPCSVTVIEYDGEKLQLIDQDNCSFQRHPADL